jgi:hypothetical protein
VKGNFATFDLVADGVILGAVFGNAAISATHGAVVPFRYYIPALPLWYRASFVALGLLAAAGTRNIALRAACVVLAISHVLRASLIGLSVDAGTIAVLLMIAGLTLKTTESRWTRRPALLVFVVALVSALLVFTVQTYSLRIFERRREAVRPKPVAAIEQTNSTVVAMVTRSDGVDAAVCASGRRGNQAAPGSR